MRIAAALRDRLSAYDMGVGRDDINFKNRG
jgi:hypothetical protein